MMFSTRGKNEFFIELVMKRYYMQYQEHNVTHVVDISRVTGLDVSENKTKEHLDSVFT